MKNRLASLQRRQEKNRGALIVSAIVHGVALAAVLLLAGHVVKQQIDEANAIKTFRPPPPPPAPAAGRQEEAEDREAHR